MKDTKIKKVNLVQFIGMLKDTLILSSRFFGVFCGGWRERQEIEAERERKKTLHLWRPDDICVFINSSLLCCSETGSLTESETFSWLDWLITETQKSSSSHFPVLELCSSSPHTPDCHLPHF